MQIFAFPYAGGSEYCYRDLSKQLKNVNFRTQALPGRGSLISQPCITRIDEMVDYLFQQIKAELLQPYIFFGHSMGAFIAYMLCQKVRQEGLPRPTALILSGRKSPSAEVGDLKHKMPATQFKAMLRDFGGIPDVVSQDEAIMALFEPVIRADFELIETYLYQQERVLDVPVHLCIGRDDNISSEEAKAWQKVTAQPLRLTYFEGGHFYFKNNESLLAHKIMEVLAVVSG